jgi:putative membrane protein
MALRALMEMELGRLAADKGSSEGVRQLGPLVAGDYLKRSATLRRACLRLGIDLPLELDKKRRTAVDRIAGMQSVEFDHAYLEQLSVHRIRP